MMGRFLRRFAPVILVLATVIFAFIGVKEVKAQSTYTKTTAVITDIRWDDVAGSDENTTYYVTVRYTANGTEMESLLDTYSSSMKVGKEIDVVYNPDDPSDVKDAGFFAVITYFAMAMISLAAAVITTIKRLNGTF